MSIEDEKRKEAEATNGTTMAPLSRPPSYHKHGGSSSYSSSDVSDATSRSSSSSRSSSAIKKKSLNDSKKSAPKYGSVAPVVPAYYDDSDTTTAKGARAGCCCECCRCVDGCYVAKGKRYSPCCLGWCGVAALATFATVLVAVVYLGLYLRCLDTREVDMFSTKLPANSTFTDLVLHTHNGEITIDASAAYDEIKFSFDVGFKNKRRLTEFKERAQNLSIDAGVILLDTQDETDYSDVWWCPDVISIAVEIPLSAWEAGAEPNYEIHSTNGAISMTKLAGGKVELETSNGEVVIDRVDATKVTVHTTNGAVHLKEVTTTEDLTVRTSNGEIGADRVDVGETAQFHTSDGAVGLKHVSAVEVVAITTDGEIVYDDVSADVVESASTNGAVSGSIELRGDDECSMEVTTTNGEVTLDPLSSPGTRSVDCDVSIKTTNGEIHASLDGFNGHYFTSTKNGDVSSKGDAKSNGDIGNGNGGDEFSFTTSNGDIVVAAKNA